MNWWSMIKSIGKQFDQQQKQSIIPHEQMLSMHMNVIRKT